MTTTMFVAPRNIWRTTLFSAKRLDEVWGSIV